VSVNAPFLDKKRIHFLNQRNAFNRIEVRVINKKHLLVATIFAIAGCAAPKAPDQAAAAAAPSTRAQTQASAQLPTTSKANQNKPTAYSTESGHPFHGKLATQSTPNWATHSTPWRTVGA
jgi:hypothetical protein